MFCAPFILCTATPHKHMKHNYALTFLFVLILFDVYSQSDTIIAYDVKNQLISEILPVLYDESITFGYTSHSLGLMDKVELNLNPPNSNLYAGTEFMKAERAELFFDIANYPVSTATKLLKYSNDSLSWCCSGIMVSENLVLTAAHCIRDHQGNWRADSILVATGFDNGEYHSDLPRSIVSKYYIFKSYYDSQSSLDYALLELEKPIGKNTGWIGIAFATDTSFFSDKVFHKFSYPADASHVDTSIHVNSDTLYYNYGKIDVLNDYFIGLKSEDAHLIPGQSGSSLFFTDNLEYYTLGIAIFSSNYGHFRISNNVFYQFKNVIDNYTGTSIDDIVKKDDFIIYPNPFSYITTIEFDNRSNQTYTISIFDIMGRIVKRESTTSNKLQIDRSGLYSGVYQVVLSSKEGFLSNSTMIIK